MVDIEDLEATYLEDTKRIVAKATERYKIATSIPKEPEGDFYKYNE